MTSQAVEETWIRTGGYGRLRGDWVNWLWEMVAHGDSTVIHFYIAAPVFIVRLRGSV